MAKWKQWIYNSLVILISLAPSLAGAKDAAEAKNSAVTTTAPTGSAAGPKLVPAAGSANVTALLGVLVMKGVLAPAEANAIGNAAPDAELQLLVEALARKGVVSAADLSMTAAPSETPVRVAPVSGVVSPQPSAANETKPVAPTVVPAVAPVRVLQLEPSRPDGLVPDLKLGSGARLKLYGMVKASVIYDTSSPYGTDMPLPGFMSASGTSFDPGRREAQSSTPRRGSRGWARTSNGPTLRGVKRRSRGSWNLISRATLRAR